MFCSCTFKQAACVKTAAIIALVLLLKLQDELVLLDLCVCQLLSICGRGGEIKRAHHHATVALTRFLFPFAFFFPFPDLRPVPLSLPDSSPSPSASYSAISLRRRRVRDL